MNNNTPESKPNIALYVAIGVAIALLVGVGLGVAVSNYQKAKPSAPVAQPLAAPAKPIGRDPNIVYGFVKEPEQTDPIELTCDFNIKDYIDNPYGYKLEDYSGSLKWINKYILGGLKSSVGKKMAREFEYVHFAKTTDSTQKLFYSIGKANTVNKEYYLTVFEPPRQYTFIEIPEAIAKRLDISPTEVYVPKHRCKIK